MDIFELKKEAQAHYGLSEDEANAFVEGFVKEAASQMDMFGGNHPVHNHFEKDSIYGRTVGGISDSLGKGIGALALNGVVAGVAGLVGSAQNASLYRQFTEALKKVVESNRVIKNADRTKVLSYAETIFKFAPHVASDANVLSQLLANAVHGEGIDPNTIETITRLEERYAGKRSFQPKNFT